MTEFALAGSQRWLQVVVNRRPELLLEALRNSGAISEAETIQWVSPLEDDHFREYRDLRALEKIEVGSLKRPLREFWPRGGPVWDALGITRSARQPVLVEAKAHISELASPATRSTPASRTLIEQSLAEARRSFAPRAKAAWSGLFFQYANRLAHHHYLRANDTPSILVFLYFVNAREMHGPTTREEWHGAIRLVHSILGIPESLRPRDVFEAFLDVRLLEGALQALEL